MYREIAHQDWKSALRVAHEIVVHLTGNGLFKDGKSNPDYAWVAKKLFQLQREMMEHTPSK